MVDWGVGGLGFYKELKKRVDAPALYFSDNGFTPYGRTPTAKPAFGTIPPLGKRHSLDSRRDARPRRFLTPRASNRQADHGPED
jgi:hypothetical protein